MLPKRRSGAVTGPKTMGKSKLAEALAEKTELKRKDSMKLLNSLAELGCKEAKKVGKFSLPHLLRIKTRNKPAAAAGLKTMFGKEVMVKARPAKVVVKAFPAAAVKKGI